MSPSHLVPGYHAPALGTPLELPFTFGSPYAAPGVVSLWTGLQCLALVQGGGGAPSTACRAGAGLTLTSADGNAIVDSFTCSKQLNKTDLEGEPSVRYSLPDLDRGYTLVIVDPDKTGLRFGEFQLLNIKSNIPEKELYLGKVESAETVAAWMPPAVPAAPEGSVGPNLHRVQLYLFEQTAAKVNLTAPADRNIFHLNNWLQMRENSGHLCGPIAGLQVVVGP
ncbi:hypothetical protein ONE63_007048 [Megalurothrips usitatus]|uniref:Uncharacterized protein n=1 Tax=Megalurothrips usitatus TaxID=439358 RepID=A0AAV7XU88_9NEOP|nr:hypothetical protein ONE63_007048 [Megalurothrips usitatus]